MRIIKSTRKLGDSIHAYCIINTLLEHNIDDVYLLTDIKWKSLFGTRNIIYDVMDGEIYALHGSNSISLENYHVRDTIGKKLSNLDKFNSTPLKIAKHLFKKPTAILCPRSSSELKSWKGNWQEIANFLKEVNYDVIFDDKSILIEDLVAYIAGADLVISVDTSCLHIADAYGVPVIGLYTYTNKDTFGPYSDKSLCLSGEISITDIKNMINVAINSTYGLKR